MFCLNKRVRLGRKRAQRRDGKQAQLTTISSQQAVEGSFLLIPKKTSSVPTCCLNEISYLKKKSSWLTAEIGQEAEGNHISQRVINLCMNTHVLITFSPISQSSFKSSSQLHWISVQSHDSLLQHEHSPPQAITVLPLLHYPALQDRRAEEAF